MKKILTVPYIDQTERWVYGCESISAVMLLQYLGLEVQPDEFIDQYLPRAMSTEMGGVMYARHPAHYYINDPRDLTGWGCYAPCICTALQNTFAAKGKAGQFAPVDETGSTAARLCERYIDSGMPVVFWATLDFVPCGGYSYWTQTIGSTTPGTTTAAAPTPKRWWSSGTASRGCTRWRSKKYPDRNIFTE